jgi:hypothetical protein
MLSALETSGRTVLGWTALLILLSYGAALGQVPAPPPSEANHSRLDQLRVDGAEALYNLEYETARRKFAEISKEFPDHPVGPLMQASTLWLEKLNQSRRLQAGLYSTQSFYAKTDEKTDPQVVEQFRKWVTLAKRLAEARVKKNPRDIQAMYYLGANDSVKAAFEASYERHFMAALHDASSSLDRQRDVLRADPNYHDAELSIGLYDYVIGSLSLPVKLLAGIAGFHGSKRRGIETLQRVAREGHWNNTDAKVVLLALLKREKRYLESLELSRELAERYPRNYLFKLENADSLALLAAAAGKTQKPNEVEVHGTEAIRILKQVLLDSSRHGEASPPIDLVHFRFGEVLLTLDQPERAEEEFLAAANSPGAEARLVTLAHLRAANAVDIAGKRDAALKEYQIVLSRANVYNSQAEARKGLREPYKKTGQ